MAGRQWHVYVEPTHRFLCALSAFWQAFMSFYVLHPLQYFISHYLVCKLKPLIQIFAVYFAVADPPVWQAYFMLQYRSNISDSMDLTSSGHLCCCFYLKCWTTRDQKWPVFSLVHNLSWQFTPSLLSGVVHIAVLSQWNPYSLLVELKAFMICDESEAVQTSFWNLSQTKGLLDILSKRVCTRKTLMFA